MCGIVGSIRYFFSEETIFHSMFQKSYDGREGYRWDEIQFYQPHLSDEDVLQKQRPAHLGEKYSILFDGKIFNREEISVKHGLSPARDSETVLLLYEKLGIDFLHELDGVFAFALLDKEANEIFFVRDRAGANPFYYFNDGKKIVFASGLNVLKSILPLEMNINNFFAYLRFGAFFREQTPYKNVLELQAGHYLRIDLKTLDMKSTRWWNVHQYYSMFRTGSIESVLEQVDDMLNRSVKRHLETDGREVGAFLSGGIDSGLTTAIASKFRPGIKTFTISFKGEYDEAPLARLVAEKYQTNHQEINISFDGLQNDIEGILCNYGEPFFDSSAVPSYYVSRESSKYIPVVINGDGADELFGGYRRYVPFAIYDFFKKNKVVRLSASALTKALPAGNDKKSLYNYIYRLLDLSSKTGIETYLSAGVDIFEGYTEHFKNSDSEYLEEPIAVFESIRSSHLSGLRKLMNLDFDINLFNDMLVKMNIATTVNSQQGRSPFLSKDFLEFVPGLPDFFKIKGKTTKVLLRRLAQKYLPDEIIGQPKRGFEVPLKKWVDHELKEIIHSYLRSNDNLYQDLVHAGFVESLLDKKISISDEKRAKILWTLLSMEVWYKKIYKQ